MTDHSLECIDTPTIWCDVCRKRAPLKDISAKKIVNRKELSSDMESKLANGKLAIVSSSESLIQFMSESDDTELLHLSEESYFNVQHVFLYNKNLKKSLKTKFDKMYVNFKSLKKIENLIIFFVFSLKRVAESGLSTEWESKAKIAYFTQNSKENYLKSQIVNKVNEQMRSLNLTDIIGIFYLLLIGIIISNVTFIFETLFKSRFSTKNN